MSLVLLEWSYLDDVPANVLHFDVENLTYGTTNVVLGIHGIFSTLWLDPPYIDFCRDPSLILKITQLRSLKPPRTCGV